MCIAYQGSTNSWDMVEGGGIISGREYSQHAMERMAPDTPQVRAELSRRAEKASTQRGLQVGTQEYYEYCKKYVEPRNIPPRVIEDAGDFIYTFRDNGFNLILFLSTYEMYVNVSITYNENIVFSQKYVNVSEIEQIDHQNIKIVLNDKDSVLLKKKPQIGVATE